MGRRMSNTKAGDEVSKVEKEIDECKMEMEQLMYEKQLIMSSVTEVERSLEIYGNLLEMRKMNNESERSQNEFILEYLSKELKHQNDTEVKSKAYLEELQKSIEIQKEWKELVKKNNKERVQKLQEALNDKKQDELITKIEERLKYCDAFCLAIRSSLEPNDSSGALGVATTSVDKHMKERFYPRHRVRGLERHDSGTRITIAEQLILHAQIARKMHTKDSSDSSSDEISDDEMYLENAKEKILKLLDEDDEVPNSGLYNMGFMKRQAENRKEELAEEAELSLQEYESLEEPSGVKNSKEGRQSGRMVFNAFGKEAPETSKKTKPDIQDRSDNYYGDSDSDDDVEHKESTDVEKDKNGDGSANQNYSFLKSIENSPGPQTTHGVSIFAEGKFRKMKNGSDGVARKSHISSDSVVLDGNLQEHVKNLDAGSDADSEEPIIDGVLLADQESFYELPSQKELIREAFAADNVEAEFEKDKEAILNEENPEPEKPVLLPGWGQWPGKKGIPSYMQKEHEIAKKKKEEAARQRKDAKFKHVFISEKMPKKPANLFPSKLPFPFTSEDDYVYSMRKPLALESNVVTIDLYRPSVVKKSGEIIKPIKFEEVNAFQKPKERKKTGLGRRNGRLKIIATARTNKSK